MPLNVGDMRCMEGNGWGIEAGSWHHDSDWQGVVAGTADVGGAEVFLVLDPGGTPAAIDAVQTADPQPVADGMLFALDGGSVVWYGRAQVVQDADESYRVVGCVFDTPLALPEMQLGESHSQTTGVTYTELNCTLAADLTLADFHDSEGAGEVRDFMADCPAEMTLTVQLAGEDIDVEVPGEGLGNNIALSWGFRKHRRR